MKATYRNLVIGLLMIFLSSLLGMYQMFMLKKCVFSLYIITLFLFCYGVYIGGK